ncbi:hypothetical protein Droror1_Dr00016079 [Drosera rotundifolia]
MADHETMNHPSRYVKLTKDQAPVEEEIKLGESADPGFSGDFEMRPMLWFLVIVADCCKPVSNRGPKKLVSRVCEWIGSKTMRSEKGLSGDGVILSVLFGVGLNRWRVVAMWIGDRGLGIEVLKWSSSFELRKHDKSRLCSCEECLSFMLMSNGGMVCFDAARV